MKEIKLIKFFIYFLIIFNKIKLIFFILFNYYNTIKKEAVLLF